MLLFPILHTNYAPVQLQDKILFGKTVIMIINYQQDVINIYFLILCVIYFLQCVFNFILKWLITKEF